MLRSTACQQRLNGKEGYNERRMHVFTQLFYFQVLKKIKYRKHSLAWKHVLRLRDVVPGGVRAAVYCAFLILSTAPT